MHNPTIVSLSRETTMLTIWVKSATRHVFTIKRFFSVASQASFLPLGPAWFSSVSEPCHYPSCLCLPLCFSFSGCPRSSPLKCHNCNDQRKLKIHDIYLCFFIHSAISSHRCVAPCLVAATYWHTVPIY